MNLVNEIKDDYGNIIAYLIKGEFDPIETTFVTPDHVGQQIGFIVYDKGQEIQPHLHLPITREVKGTTECIVVKKGECILDLYNKNKEILSTHKIKQNDIILLLGGAHGFRMTEDTILLEVKQGPFVKEQDKLRFDRPI